METESQQDGMGIGKEKDEQGGVEGVGENTTNSGDSYAQSRTLWKLYLAGKITATELNQRLLKDGGLIGDTEKKVKDLFNAKEI